MNPSLLKFVGSVFQCRPSDLSADDCRLRLARVPASSRLIYGQDPNTGIPSVYPVLAVRNVYLLPGVPPYFRMGFDFIKVRGGETYRLLKLFMHRIYTFWNLFAYLIVVPHILLIFFGIKLTWFPPPLCPRYNRSARFNGFT